MSKVCTALTKSGVQCSRSTEGLVCWQHDHNRSPKSVSPRSISPRSTRLTTKVPTRTSQVMKPINGVVLVLSAHQVLVEDMDCDLKPYNFPVRELDQAKNIIIRALEPMEVVMIDTKKGVARVLLDTEILTEGQYAHLLKLFKKTGDGIVPDHIVNNRMKFFNVNDNTQMWLDLEGVEVYKNGNVTVYDEKY